MTNQVILNGHDAAKPHFVLVPFMAQGHMIPMIDLAHLLALRGVFVTVITTPYNATRIRSTIDHAHDSGLPIQFVEFPFPCKELGLPEGGENVDILPPHLMLKFFQGLSLLAEPVKLYLQDQQPYPTCMINDVCHHWTKEVAQNLQIPRITFFSICCFTLLCTYNLSYHKLYDTSVSDHEPFEVPGLTQKIMVTKAQAPEWFDGPGFENYAAAVKEAQLTADGIVVNTFDDLEPSYVESYQKAMGKKVWAVGPFFLYNKDIAGMTIRGAKTSVDSELCLSWLNSMKRRSVTYVSFGSLTYVGTTQLKEIGLGLEASSHPFVWVIKNCERSQELEEWLAEGYEERVRSRGLIIKGWAPQVMILSHPAVGGFMTHCGWNSTLEGVTAGVPMITWPYFADQFLNERMVVDVLKVGVSIGVQKPLLAQWEGDNKDLKVFVKRNEVERAVRSLMEDGEVTEERRKRVEEFGRKAKEAMEEGGSSYATMTDLVQYFSGNVNQNVER